MARELLPHGRFRSLPTPNTVAMNTPHTDPAQENDTDTASGPFGDPILRALARAEENYRAVRAVWDRDAADAQRLRDELARAQDTAQQVAREAQQARAELEVERQRSARERDRAAQLADALRDLHRAAIGGNVFELILKACLSVTGATRGLYVVAWDGGRMRARAAVDVDGYPGKEPSPFVRALCERSIAGRDTFLADGPDALRGLPAPDGPGETFANCLAAPAVLLRRFNGVVILADKPGRGFDRDDVDLVLSIGDQAGVAVENRALQDQLLRAHLSVVGVLADAIEAKDPYTKGHCEMVARLARRTAERLAADDEALRAVAGYGGLLHDVGKIGVSDGVLCKPGKLLPEEWALMQSHVRIGRDLLSHVPALAAVAAVVLSHHERWDGTGYPDGLKGEAIPLAARIVCAVDAYSAMVSKRSYKESMADADARRELLRCKGSHFDPAVVDALLAVLDEPEPAGDVGELLSELDSPGDFRRVLRG